MMDLGFKSGKSGVHSSRTIMLDAIALLLNHVQRYAQHEDYLNAVIEDNLLAKNTLSTRKTTADKLVALYGLSDEILIFKIFRELFYFDRSSIPMLALLCALARDPLLRSSAEWTLNISPGEKAKKDDLIRFLQNTFEDDFYESTINSMARNILSSWTQSGHFKGVREKIRQRPRLTPAIVCYALFLGYLNGQNGLALFDTPWARVCDSSLNEMASLAQSASRQGVLDFKIMGDVIECRFPRFLSQKEEAKIHEQN